MALLVDEGLRTGGHDRPVAGHVVSAVVAVQLARSVSASSDGDPGSAVLVRPQTVAILGRPRVICPMHMSLDGKIAGDYLPTGVGSASQREFCGLAYGCQRHRPADRPAGVRD